MGELPCSSQPTAPTCVVWSWRLKQCLADGFEVQRSDGHAMLISRNKSETAVHGCHYQAVLVREVLARPWVGARVLYVCLSARVICLFCNKTITGNNKTRRCKKVRFSVKYSEENFIFGEVSYWEEEGRVGGRLFEVGANSRLGACSN